MGEGMNIILEGEKLTLRKMEQPELKNIDTKIMLSFDFYIAKYKDCEFILLEPTKKECNRYRLTWFSNISKYANNIFRKPVVFLFNNLIYKEENIMPLINTVVLMMEYYVCVLVTLEVCVIDMA